MNDKPQTSYDLLPYHGAPYQGSHPDQLATIASLFGLNPPEVDQCRVLELGCSDGGNLIPMAVSLPSATFVGVDLSSRQIASGQSIIKSLGLGNIKLEHRDILDLGPADAMFDYIICHGVYSWVPQPVRDHILEICSANLVPEGVAYVSYNTYPGWFMRGMVREMMRFHADQFDNPQTQVEQARALLDFLIAATPEAGDDTYHILLRRELEIIRNRKDTYLYHEHLEQVNDPVFFWRFVEHAAEHGLRYLGESQFSQMVPENFSSQVSETLQALATNIIHMEQYMDFIRNRQFRQTLLCHQALTPNRQLVPERLNGMYVATQLRPTAEGADLTADDEIEFRSPYGVTVSVSQPLAKAALANLGSCWPRAVAVADLPEFAYGDSLIVRNADQYQQDLVDVCRLILELYVADLVQLRVTPHRGTHVVSERPVCSALTRLLSKDQVLATNQLHELVELGDLDRQILQRLDGEHDLNALVAIVESLVRDGELVIHQEGKRLGPENVTREVLAKIVRGRLEVAAGNALLTS